MSRQLIPSFSVKESTRQAIFLVVLCLLAISVFRVARAAFMPELPNFSPVTALAFCGGLFLPGLVGWLLPLAILIASDVALCLLLGYPLMSGGQLVAWGATLGVVALGRWISFRGSISPLGFFGSLLGGSVLFYIVTNAASWVMNSAYPRTFEGLWVSLTVGLPGFPPTWTFFRNSLISDMLFASILLAVWALASRGETPRSATSAA